MRDALLEGLQETLWFAHGKRRPTSPANPLVLGLLPPWVQSNMDLITPLLLERVLDVSNASVSRKLQTKCVIIQSAMNSSLFFYASFDLLACKTGHEQPCFIFCLHPPWLRRKIITLGKFIFGRMSGL